MVASNLFLVPGAI